MPKIVCPYCKKYDYCSVVKSGNISQIYKCWTCEGEFEADNPNWKIVKNVSGVALTVLAVAVGSDKGGGNPQT